MRLVVTDAAAADVAAAADWYEAPREGLGEAFVAAVDVSIEQILEQPLRCRVVHPALRRALLPRFPCCIFCREDQDQVLVLAVLHGSRDPRAWRRRS